MHFNGSVEITDENLIWIKRQMETLFLLWFYMHYSNRSYSKHVFTENIENSPLKYSTLKIVRIVENLQKCNMNHGSVNENPDFLKYYSVFFPLFDMKNCSNRRKLAKKKWITVQLIKILIFFILYSLFSTFSLIFGIFIFFSPVFFFQIFFKLFTFCFN